MYTEAMLCIHLLKLFLRLLLVVRVAVGVPLAVRWVFACEVGVCLCIQHRVHLHTTTTTTTYSAWRRYAFLIVASSASEEIPSVS